MAEGLLRGKREALRVAFDRFYAGAGELPELDRIDRSDELDRLFIAVLDGHSADEIRAAVRAAVRPKRMTIYTR